MYFLMPAGILWIDPRNSLDTCIVHIRRVPMAYINYIYIHGLCFVLSTHFAEFPFITFKHLSNNLYSLFAFVSG